MTIVRTTIILGVLFLIGLGHIFIFESRLTTTREQHVQSKRVLHVTADEIQRIKIRRDYWTSTLIEKTETDGFRMVEPFPSDIEGDIVTHLLSTIEFMEKKSVLENTSGNPLKRSDYGLDPPELEISIETNEGDEINMAMGKTALDGKGVYFQVHGEDNIYVVNGEIGDAANRLLDISTTQ